MTQRGESYIQQLDAIFNEYQSLLNQIGDDQWQSIADEDGRQINVMVDHVVIVQQNMTDVVRLAAAGKPLPEFTMDDIEAGNLVHMAEAREVGRADLTNRMQQAMDDYRMLFAGLTDAELDRTTYFVFFGGDVSPAIVTEQAMIVHAGSHPPPLRSAVEALSPTG